MARAKRIPIVLFPEPGKRVGQAGSKSAKTGRVSSKAKFTASLEADASWIVYVDSRDLCMLTGEPVLKHIKDSIRRDVNPETGAPNPTEIRRADGEYVPRKVNGNEMASHVTRTVTDSTRRWGPGGKKIAQDRTRLKVYFNSRKYAALNKRDSNRTGKNRAVYLGLGGKLSRHLANGTTQWMDGVLAGDKFEKDTLSRARGQ